MRAAALFSLLFWQAVPQGGPQNGQPVARPEHMRYVRAMDVPAGAGQACAALDAAIFPHSLPSLTDARIFSLQRAGDTATPHEVPYAITLSEAESEETEQARVLNLGAGTGRDRAEIVFDLEMPDRAYTGVTLDLAGQDFLATATVSGTDSLDAREQATALGAFTLFDLSSQHLSRDTTIALEESTFRYLHIVLRVSPAPRSGAAGRASARFSPAMVEGAEVPPSREAESVYTTVAETNAFATAGRESHASFTVPARVPIERVSFALASGFNGNFSREVRITAVADAAGDGNTEDDSGRALLPESVSGTILRVHASEAGREIDAEQLNVPAILGANLQRAAKVEVAVENGDDQPLPIAAVRLEMRERRLCFEAPSAGVGLALYYGDATLTPPVYEYDRLFEPVRMPLAAVLGPERLNPDYRPLPAEEKPSTERHPEVLWIAVIAVICVLGVVALRSARNLGR
jgi:hypothetical protein